MSATQQSLRTLRSPRVQLPPLEGPHARRRRQRDPWLLIAAILAIGAAIVIANKAKGATGHGSPCEDDADCPPALHCASNGRCAS